MLHSYPISYCIFVVELRRMHVRKHNAIALYVVVYAIKVVSLLLRRVLAMQPAMLRGATL